MEGPDSGEWSGILRGPNDASVLFRTKTSHARIREGAERSRKMFGVPRKARDSWAVQRGIRNTVEVRTVYTRHTYDPLQRAQAMM